jgi:hypothetical protein
MDMLKLILQDTTLNGNKKRMPPTERAIVTDWSPPALGDIKSLLGVVINMGLYPMSDITDQFSQAWVNKVPFFLVSSQGMSFSIVYWNLHFAHAEAQGKLRREDLIKSVLDKIRSKCVMYYSPSFTVAVDENTISFNWRVSFKTYNPMKPVKFGLKLFCTICH